MFAISCPKLLGEYRLTFGKVSIYFTATYPKEVGVALYYGSEIISFICVDWDEFTEKLSKAQKGMCYGAAKWLEENKRPNIIMRLERWESGEVGYGA